MKIAAVANAGASHQMTMCAIGRELQQRGHDFVLVGTQFQADQLRLPDIPFELLGNGAADPADAYWESARKGNVTLSATVQYMKGMAALLCDELPSLLTRSKVDFVLSDQEEPGSATAADLADVPYASICSSLPLNEAVGIPPGFLEWPYSASALAEVRNRFGYQMRNIAVGGVNRVLNRYRKQAGLPLYRKPDDSFSTLAQITQLVPEFDFPRQVPLPVLHYVGPFQRQALSTTDFPFERLDGRPLVYASFGTIFGRRWPDLLNIARACATLPVQLVISLGGAQPGAEQASVPGDPIVVGYAPQRELLARAALTITHAGLNTALECLTFGVPLLAVPMAGDQWGVSERIRYHQAGLTLDRKRRGVREIRSAVTRLLEEPQWKATAKRLQAAVTRSGGAGEAARIIENASARSEKDRSGRVRHA